MQTSSSAGAVLSAVGGTSERLVLSRVSKRFGGVTVAASAMARALYVKQSGFGLRLAAIRAAEHAAAGLGAAVHHSRLAARVVSGVLTGLAGALIAFRFEYLAVQLGQRQLESRRGPHVHRGRRGNPSDGHAGHTSTAGGSSGRPHVGRCLQTLAQAP
ncbi:ABC transporter permease subunit [Streptomyces sp. TRM68367]|uniref:ABC transporter permease subunit n=1 Tax=Streptomyces sp. TRM68367 TaxID=2758415 RepID=UPI00165C6FB7|nr:hypothetical protein [Streptomyces sp. TRM68367]MBC9726582.1 hypothetical protein [Streptomyces sp. TRM68367]